MEIDGTLDLHGHTRNSAHAALIRFVERAQEKSARILLVITGKGSMENGERGVLRRELPHWLELHPLKEAVLSHPPARPEHGGSGALYLILRRKKK